MFSEKTSAARKTFSLSCESFLQTATFLDEVIHLWKVFNCKTPLQSNYQRNPDRAAVYSSTQGNGSIDAPPSFKPAKKYSDISGLEARYTDPQTKMRFANADEYGRVRMLPGDIISGCLQLRKAKTLMKWKFLQ
ncbi:LOW QUALITY PROTEIN: ino80 complex subunit c [Plakobranchus ocellatus]|uniref:Ino80 complex subunit c n=1 Tax=Plakobranchus ocellatus TaxID=259542 RepID=A0AAV4CQZ4_9GAST|nr:LOW QUALITY PROTEIN: ino80 complex subunit c [Plakobranchus ocellatus]